MFRKTNSTAPSRFEAIDEGRGIVTIKLIGPTLEVLDALKVSNTVRRQCLGNVPVRVNIDMSQIKLIGRQCTVVLAVFVELARQVAAQVRLISLVGQPAAAVSLYNRNLELRRLLGTLDNFTDRVGGRRI